MPVHADRVSERFGKAAISTAGTGIWFHAVSAGEVISAAPVIRRVAAAFPKEKILVSTMTVTGYAQVQRLLSDHVEHTYAPYDFPWAIRRFLGIVKPRVLILMETELWPNLMRQLDDRGISVLLMNARLSERSFKGYKRVGGLSRPMFSSLTWTGCQYSAHARRLEALGVDRLSITGSVKFDLDIPDDLEEECKALVSNFRLEGRKIWIAASTHAVEEQLMLDTHRELLKYFPDLLLVIVPRHPERFATVIKSSRQYGFTTGQLSSLSSSVDSMQVLVGDEMGRLMYLYAVSHVVFVGGTMSGTGGHNIIEPASLGKPIVAGPSRFNFTEIFCLFESANAVIEIASRQDLVNEVASLIQSEDNRAQMGSRARQLVQKNSGATDKVLQKVIPLIEAALGEYTGAKDSSG